MIVLYKHYERFFLTTGNAAGESHHVPLPAPVLRLRDLPVEDFLFIYFFLNDVLRQNVILYDEGLMNTFCSESVELSQPASCSLAPSARQRSQISHLWEACGMLAWSFTAWVRVWGLMITVWKSLWAPVCVVRTPAGIDKWEIYKLRPLQHYSQSSSVLLRLRIWLAESLNI